VSKEFKYGIEGLLMAIAFFILLIKYDHDPIWKQKENNSPTKMISPK